MVLPNNSVRKSSAPLPPSADGPQTPIRYVFGLDDAVIRFCELHHAVKCGASVRIGFPPYYLKYLALFLFNMIVSPPPSPSNDKISDALAILDALCSIALKQPRVMYGGGGCYYCDEYLDSVY